MGKSILNTIINRACARLGRNQRSCTCEIASRKAHFKMPARMENVMRFGRRRETRRNEKLTRFSYGIRTAPIFILQQCACDAPAFIRHQSDIDNRKQIQNRPVYGPQLVLSSFTRRLRFSRCTSDNSDRRYTRYRKRTPIKNTADCPHRSYRPVVSRPELCRLVLTTNGVLVPLSSGYWKMAF